MGSPATTAAAAAAGGGAASSEAPSCSSRHTTTDTSHHRDRRLCGPLLKRRDHLTYQWKPRLFLAHMEDHLLLYYMPGTAPATAPPRGVLPLAGCEVHVLDRAEAGGKMHAFRLSHPWLGKPWVLAARSRQEREHWIRSLRRLISEAQAALLDEEDDGMATPSGGEGLEGSQEDAEEEEEGERKQEKNALLRHQPLHPHLKRLIWPGYEEPVHKALRRLLEYAEPSTGWKLNFERHGVKAYKREQPGKGESFTTLKGTGIIRHHPIACLMAIMDNTIGREIDRQFDFGRRERILNEHNWVDYLKYHGIFPVAPRDMFLYVHWRVLEEQDGAILIVVFSDDKFNSYPQGPGCVRAECVTAGWILRPVDPPHANATYCTYFSMADLKGYIPKKLVEFATEPQPLLVHTIGEILSKEKTGKFSVNRRTFTSKEGRGRYTTRDVVPYVNRIHRVNLDPGEEFKYPWLLTEEEKLKQAAMQERDAARQAAAAGGGGGGRSNAFSSSSTPSSRVAAGGGKTTKKASSTSSSSSSSSRIIRGALFRAWLVFLAVAFVCLLVQLEPLWVEVREAPSWGVAGGLVRDKALETWHWMCLYLHSLAYHLGFELGRGNGGGGGKWML